MIYLDRDAHCRRCQGQVFGKAKYRLCDQCLDVVLYGGSAKSDYEDGFVARFGRPRLEEITLRLREEYCDDIAELAQRHKSLRLQSVQIGLGLVSGIPQAAVVAPPGPRVELVDASAVLLQTLRRDELHFYRLSADDFEIFLCDRLFHWGLEPRRVGRVNQRDGGVDIVAWPRASSSFPFLLAVQAKHHANPDRKTGPAAIREFQAVVATHRFQAGLLVTNTRFTPDAQWFAMNHAHLLRLRDIDDLRRWLWDRFGEAAEWREIPSQLELCPGVVIQLPIGPSGGD